MKRPAATFPGRSAPGQRSMIWTRQPLKTSVPSGSKRAAKKQLATLSKEQLLHDCGAITDDGVTYAALILFGKNATIIKYLPQAEIIFEYRSSEASGPANQREEFKVGFFACYDRVWELVNLRNDKQHYQEGFFVFDIATFNERVVREAILNAVSHRNYQFGGSIFVLPVPRQVSCSKAPEDFPSALRSTTYWIASFRATAVLLRSFRSAAWWSVPVRA